MKRISILVATILLSLGAFAQAPQKMSYQAVIRDAKQNIVINDPVATKISILQGTATGTEVYVETHSSATNSNGLVSLEIGMGNVISGDFSTIDWANGPYFVKTETDIKGGSKYTITGTSQMLSVPFALYAANSGSSTPGPQGPQGPIGFTGLTGPAGADGEDGKSAYYFWLEAGNTGTEAEFLASLQGPAGNAGPTGPQGPIGFTGLTGPAGTDGEDGKSAYYLWLEAGNTGTEAEFLASLQGPAGNDGATGPQGPIGFTGLTGPAGADGEDGKSAYYLWLEAGNTGTEADFLASLEGPAGTYTAGYGIEITSGEISTIPPTSSEYIFLQPDALIGGYVGFGTAAAINGMSYNASTDEITLQAKKTYVLDGAVYLSDTESGGTYSFVFYDKTNNTPIGTESLQTSTDYAGVLINQPVMSAIITPDTSIQVSVQNLSGVTGVIDPSKGFLKITELK